MILIREHLEKDITKTLRHATFQRADRRWYTCKKKLSKFIDFDALSTYSVLAIYGSDYVPYRLVNCSEVTKKRAQPA